MKTQANADAFFEAIQDAGQAGNRLLALGQNLLANNSDDTSDSRLEALLVLHRKLQINENVADPIS